MLVKAHRLLNGLAASIGLGALGFAQPSLAQQYSLTELRAEGSSNYVYGYGINDHGQVVGVINPPNAPNRNVVWDSNGSIISSLERVGTASNAPVDINNAGQVVGFASSVSTGNAYPYRAVTWNGTTATFLPTLNGNSSSALGINDQGQAVGRSEFFDSRTQRVIETHGVVWDGATVRDLGAGTSAQAINNLGQVVGRSSLGGTLWNGAEAVALGADLTPVAINDNGMIVGRFGSAGVRVLADGSSFELEGLPSHTFGVSVNDLNNAGQMVGYSNNNFTGPLATLWNGTATPINLNAFLTGPAALYITLTEATGINERGQIVAVGYDLRTAGTRTYLLSPVPLPASAWLLLSALSSLSLSARTRVARVKELLPELQSA